MTFSAERFGPFRLNKAIHASSLIIENMYFLLKPRCPISVKQNIIVEVYLILY